MKTAADVLRLEGGREAVRRKIARALRGAGTSDLLKHGSHHGVVGVTVDLFEPALWNDQGQMPHFIYELLQVSVHDLYDLQSVDRLTFEEIAQRFDN